MTCTMAFPETHERNVFQIIYVKDWDHGTFNTPLLELWPLGTHFAQTIKDVTDNSKGVGEGSVFMMLNGV